MHERRRRASNFQDSKKGEGEEVKIFHPPRFTFPSRRLFPELLAVAVPAASIVGVAAVGLGPGTVLLIVL